MTLTQSQRRSWSRWGDREIQRTIDAAKAKIAAEERARNEARKREPRMPKPPAVMPDVRVGDTVLIGHIRPAKVTKVNAKSVVTEGGTRWGISEFEVVKP